MNGFPVFVAGFAYFALGGLWFSPLFGKQWDKAVGFARPAKWRPSAIYYLGPLLGCLVASCVTSVLAQWALAVTIKDHVAVGFVVGLGYGMVISSVNAIAPNMPRPGLYAVVVGSYHLTGLLLVSMVLFWLS